MTIIEKALTRLETINQQEKKKKKEEEKKPAGEGEQGLGLELEPLPTFTQPPGVDFIVNRVKRKRNRQMWIAPAVYFTVAVFAVLFSWRANLFGVKQLVGNSESYRFVMAMIESTGPQTLRETAGREATFAPKSIPESSVSLIAPAKKPKIIVNKPEITRPEITRKETTRASSKTKEYPWIKKGWAALDRGKPKAALKSWEAGLRSLPGRHLVLVLDVHENWGDALKKLRVVDKGNSAFVARGKSSASKKRVYYLLSAPHRRDLQDVRKRIASALDRSNVRGNYANKLLARMDSGGKTGKKKQTAVAKKVDSKPKRIKKVRKQETLSYGQRIGIVKDLLNDSLYSDAVDKLQPLFDNPPVVWEPYLLMGTAYMGLGDLGVADSYFKKGLVIDKNRPRLWLQRAVVAQQQGDHDAALKILRKVEALAPRMPEIKLNIGYSSDVLGKKDNAVKAYQSFMALTEGRRDYFSLRLQVLQRLLELGYKSVG